MDVDKKLSEKGYYSEEDLEREVEHVEPPEWRDEAKETFDYSVEKIKDDLGYEPEFSLKAGIEEIVRSV